MRAGGSKVVPLALARPPERGKRLERLQVRVEDSLIERLDDAASSLSARACGLEVDRAGVMRLALVRGLAALERELEAGGNVSTCEEP